MSRLMKNSEWFANLFSAPQIMEIEGSTEGARWLGWGVKKKYVKELNSILKTILKNLDQILCSKNYCPNIEKEILLKKN